MIGSLIGWTVLGVVAGLLARLIHPGPDSMGLVSTFALGVGGSLLGGAAAYVLRLGTTPYEPGGWILATLGSVALLAMGLFGTRPRAVP